MKYKVNGVINHFRNVVFPDGSVKIFYVDSTSLKLKQYFDSSIFL